jgi:uncharacterized protein YukE
VEPEFKVNPHEVKKHIGELDCLVDEFSSLVGEFGDLVPPVQAFGWCAQPSAMASMNAHQTLLRAMQALAQVFQQANQNVRTAMNNYLANDSSGASSLEKITGYLTAATNLVSRLGSRGLDSGAIHDRLLNQSFEVSQGVARVYVGDPRQANFQPNDTVTAPGFAATVGADGRLYHDNRVVSLPAGQQIWVYRPMRGA